MRRDHDVIGIERDGTFELNRAAPGFAVRDRLADLSLLDTNAYIDLTDTAQPTAYGSWSPDPDLQIAVLIPCHNEAVTIARVVRDFRRVLPTASVYVYDNASTDGTAELAAAAGAIVRRAPTLGKGNVLRRMFSEVDATVYVLADGDGTYDTFAAPRFIQRLRAHHLDMVVGRRVEIDKTAGAYRRGHKVGNRLLGGSVHWIFGEGSVDMLSGYRVFSRRYVKSFPAFSRGFETETEMTIHALDLRLSFEELPVAYCQRPTASHSKLRTIPDGLRILLFILLLCKEYRPLRFFGALAGACSLGALAAAPAVHILPNWAARPGIGIAFIALAALFLTAGVIVDSVSRSRREMKRILFLTVAHVGESTEVAPATPANVDSFVG